VACGRRARRRNRHAPAPIPRLRPPLFSSPYEAAAWAIISARRPARQAAATRSLIAERLGREFELAGERLAAFPTPDRLLLVEPLKGLPQVKVERLHALAEATLAGRLDADRLRALEPAAALAELQELPGIGPFYSLLVLVRSSGHADLLPAGERRVLACAARTGTLHRARRALASVSDLGERAASLCGRAGRSRLNHGYWLALSPGLGLNARRTRRVTQAPRRSRRSLRGRSAPPPGRSPRGGGGRARDRPQTVDAMSRPHDGALDVRLVDEQLLLDSQQLEDACIAGAKRAGRIQTPAPGDAGEVAPPWPAMNRR
jgi:hypothetical protein